MKKELLLMYAAIMFSGAMVAVGITYMVTEDVMITAIVGVVLLVGDSIALAIFKKKMVQLPQAPSSKESQTSNVHRP